MKLYMSVDMEGIWGIVDPMFIKPGDRLYERGCELMTEEVNRVAKFAFEWGVKEIHVNDSHNDMNNLIVEKLHPSVHLLSGSPKKLSMMEGIDESFDGAFFIGYHTRNGAPGVLSHTMAQSIRNLTINGQVVGEFGINVLIAEKYGVPALLLTGDQEVAKEAVETVPTIETAIVKYATSRTSARNLSEEARDQILKESIFSALDKLKDAQGPVIKSPFKMDIEFSHYGEAEAAAVCPGTMQEGCVVSYTSESSIEIYRAMRTMLRLTESVRFFD